MAIRLENPSEPAWDERSASDMQPEPSAFATTMLANVQGAALIASTLADPDVLADEIERLKSWINGLATNNSQLQTHHHQDPSQDRSKK